MKGIPECFISNDLSPRVFWLFPAPDKEISIDAVVSRIPEAVYVLTQDDDTPVPLEEAYVNPLVEWMLFRAFSKDAAGGAESGLAAQHYQSFVEQLGIKQGQTVHCLPVKKCLTEVECECCCFGDAEIS